jgi:hypothetical protein
MARLCKLVTCQGASLNQRISCSDAINIHLFAALGPVENDKTPPPKTIKLPQKVPPLFPVYLPFRTHITLWRGIQTISELACFNFGQRAMPDVLSRNG